MIIIFIVFIDNDGKLREDVQQLKALLSSARNEKIQIDQELEEVKQQLSKTKNDHFEADQARLRVEIERNELKRENEILKDKFEANNQTCLKKIENERNELKKENDTLKEILEQGWLQVNNFLFN